MSIFGLNHHVFQSIVNARYQLDSVKYCTYGINNINLILSCPYSAIFSIHRHLINKREAYEWDTGKQDTKFKVSMFVHMYYKMERFVLVVWNNLVKAIPVYAYNLLWS